jgi:hypothetical protein
MKLARRFAWCVTTLAIVTLRGGDSRAEDAVGPPRHDSPVRGGATALSPPIVVGVRSNRDTIGVEARCRVEASRATAWRVLTDYDGIDGFVSSMKESRVTAREDGWITVEQVAIGRLFLLTRRMRATLRVHEEPQSRIRFQDVLHRDFLLYDGEWRLEERGGSVEIAYRVEARPAFAVPDLVAREMLRRTVRELLGQVTAEIARREAIARGRGAIEISSLE